VNGDHEFRVDAVKKGDIVHLMQGDRREAVYQALQAKGVCGSVPWPVSRAF
jgi:hypothetical protein